MFTYAYAAAHAATRRALAALSVVLTHPTSTAAMHLAHAAHSAVLAYAGPTELFALAAKCAVLADTLPTARARALFAPDAHRHFGGGNGGCVRRIGARFDRRLF